MIGALAGTALVPHMPQATLERISAVFLLLMGGFVLYQDRGVFADTSSSIRTVTTPAVV